MWRVQKKEVKIILMESKTFTIALFTFFFFSIRRQLSCCFEKQSHFMHETTTKLLVREKN